MEIKINKKSILIALITAMIMTLSSITIYSSIASPKFYNDFFNTGIKYLNEGKYEEAILVFEKAIQIEEKSTEARVYLAQGYVGTGDIDKVVETLGQAQDIETQNEELLKDILDILNKVSPESMEEFVNKYVESVGKENISDDIKDILETAQKPPVMPKLEPNPDTYIKDIQLKLKLDDIKLGHTYYYTVDGSEPTNASTKYTGKINIKESTNIKLVGYNKNGDKTEVQDVEYIIDKNILKEVKDLILESEKLQEDTKAGEEVGNTTKEVKDNFQVNIDKSKKVVAKKELTYKELSTTKTELKKAMKIFQENIIEPTDKSKLESVVNEAQNLHDNSSEGSSDGQYKSGSKATLMSAIKKAKEVLDNKIVKQDVIDEEVSYLNNSIREFKNAKITNSGVNMALQKFINAMNKAIDFPPYLDSINFESPKVNGNMTIYSDPTEPNENNIVITKIGNEYECQYIRAVGPMGVIDYNIGAIVSNSSNRVYFEYINGRAVYDERTDVYVDL